MSEFWRLDATAQALLVREKSIKPSEFVDEAIARIESLNPKLNAVVTEMFDRARAEAAVAVADGLFAGVPFLLKDLVAEYAGVPLTEGSAFLDSRYTISSASRGKSRGSSAATMCGSRRRSPSRPFPLAASIRRRTTRCRGSSGPRSSCRSRPSST